MLSAPSAGPLPPDPGAKPAGLCRARLCAAARTPARAASRRRAMPLAPVRRTPLGRSSQAHAGGAARCPAALRCPSGHGRRAVFSWWILVSRRSRGSLCRGTVSAASAVRLDSSAKPWPCGRRAGVSPGGGPPRPPLSRPRHGRLARFAARVRVVDAAAAASGAMDRCPAARSPAAASPRFPEPALPFELPFLPRA